MVIIAVTKINDLVITKEEYLNAIPDFIKHYGRLPFMREDSVTIEVDEEYEDKDGITSTRTAGRQYKGLKYATEYFGSVDKCIDALFDKGVLSFKIISNIINIKENRVEELINKTAKKVDKHERRMLEVFFNKDYYKELGKYNETHCKVCTKVKQCGQHYYIDLMGCERYKKSKVKNKM